MPSKKIKKKTAASLTRKQSLPLDVPAKPTPPPPLVRICWELYGTVANILSGSGNMEAFNQLISFMLLMTLDFMRQTYGDKATLDEVGRALRTLNQKAGKNNG